MFRERIISDDRYISTIYSAKFELHQSSNEDQSQSRNKFQDPKHYRPVRVRGTPWGQTIGHLQQKKIRRRSEGDYFHVVLLLHFLSFFFGTSHFCCPFLEFNEWKVETPHERMELHSCRSNVLTVLLALRSGDAPPSAITTHCVASALGYSRERE